MNTSEQDFSLWRAAVDEAGHVIEGRKLGVSIKSAVINPSGVCQTVPDFSTVTTVEVAAKLRLAGLVALMVMKCWNYQDAKQPDFVTTKQWLTKKRAEQGLSEQFAARQAEVDMQRWLNEVRATLSEPETRTALEKCAEYMFEHHHLDGDDVEEVITSFFITSPA